MNKKILNRVVELKKKAKQIPEELISLDLYAKFRKETARDEVYNEIDKIKDEKNKLIREIVGFFNAILEGDSIYFENITKLSFEPKGVMYNLEHFKNNASWTEDRKRLINLLEILENEIKEKANLPQKINMRLTNSKAIIIAALIGIIPAILTYFFKPEKSIIDIHKDYYNKIIPKINRAPGYKSYVYPNMCIGFSAPTSWTIEDAAAVFAGSEFSLVKRYEETGGIIGVKFRIQAVQKNYINNIEKEIENQLKVLEKIDSDTTVKDEIIGGKLSKCFSYKQRTGRLYGDIKLFFVRLIPEVKLVIIAFARHESSDQKEFWNEFNLIKQSIYFDISEVKKRIQSMKKIQQK